MVNYGKQSVIDNYSIVDNLMANDCEEPWLVMVNEWVMYCQ